MRLTLDVPAGYSFRRTVLSHGWCALAPFSLGRAAMWLETTVALHGGGAARIRLAPDRDHVVLEARGRHGAVDRATMVAAARRILALDVDLTVFYAVVEADDELRWIAETGSGRLLRGASIFEDVVKLILTTNCTWSLTTKMVRSLVDTYGERSPDGSRSFPTPETLARAGTRALRDRMRLGYRAPYIAELSRKVARGEVDLERWENDPRDAAELEREIVRLPGVGPYVAQNLLKLVGRPRGLALDSWMRAKYSKLFHGGRTVTDRTIARRYSRLGAWAGPALWLELTRDWWEGDEPSAAWESLT